MKKNLLLFLFLLFSIHAMSQEKGAHLTLSGGVGPTGFTYKMTGIEFAKPSRDLLLGGQAGLGFSYYFTKHVGLSIGAGLSHYRTKANLMGEFDSKNYLNLGDFIDNDPFEEHVTHYQLRARTQDWEEFHSAKLLEIPLTLNLQKKFGAKEGFGLYLALGAKFQLPIATRYEIADGKNSKQQKLNISGYYKEKDLELGTFNDPDLSQHGFGSINNPSKVLTDASGKLDLSFNVSLIGEAGILISLSRRVDLSLGAFIDYGLLNINNKKDSETDILIAQGSDYVAGAENYKVGKGITYNSILHSKYVNKVSTISYGGKLGLRIKLGKLSKKEESKPVSMLPPKSDTLYVKTDGQLTDSLLKVILNRLDRLKGKTQEPAHTEKPVLDVPEEGTYDYYPGVYEEFEMQILFEPVYFDLDKAVLKPESITILNAKIIILHKYPEIKLLVYGNTCDLGNNAHNYILGQQRADAVKNYLINKGIRPERFETSTLSKFNPVLPNISEENRMHNRRADFKPLFLKKK